MKRIYAGVFFILAVTLLQAQRMDSYWMVGYQNHSPDPAWQGSDIVFSDTGIVRMDNYQRTVNFGATFSAIADAAGNLLFYTNGYLVANARHDTVGKLYWDGVGIHADDSYALTPQCALILPVPDDSNLFHLFHVPLKYVQDANAKGWNLYHSLLDRRLRNGDGGMVFANQLVVEDTLAVSGLNAVRHANGRDWWLVKFDIRLSNYYSVLISPQGLKVSHLTVNGLPPTPCIGVNQSGFSKDGSLYVRKVAENNYATYLFDFDRCAGTFSNPRTITAPDAAHISYASVGCAISPSGKLLYATEGHHDNYYICQYDLTAQDISDTRNVVAVHDGLGGVFGAFSLGYTAPDGRIYFAENTRRVTVIRQPEVYGTGCDLRQHELLIPSVNGHTVPNYPNFYLGPLAGSGCDTLALSAQVPLPAVPPPHVHPNPTEGLLHFGFGQPSPGPLRLLLRNSHGQPVAQSLLPEGTTAHTLDLRGLPAGLYHYEIRSDGRLAHSGRIILAKD